MDRRCGANRYGDKVGNGTRCIHRSFERRVGCELSLKADAEVGRSVALKVESACKDGSAAKILSKTTKT